MVDKETMKSIPLVSCAFKAEIAQGYADVTFNQVYENSSDASLETLFMMPTNANFSVNKLAADFYLEDGTEHSFETRVTEKEKAKVEYEDADG